MTCLQIEFYMYSSSGLFIIMLLKPQRNFESLNVFVLYITEFYKIKIEYLLKVYYLPSSHFINLCFRHVVISDCGKLKRTVMGRSSVELRSYHVQWKPISEAEKNTDSVLTK